MEDLVPFLVSQLSVYFPESVSESGGRTILGLPFLVRFKEKNSNYIHLQKGEKTRPGAHTDISLHCLDQDYSSTPVADRVLGDVFQGDDEFLTHFDDKTICILVTSWSKTHLLKCKTHHLVNQ